MNSASNHFYIFQRPEGMCCMLSRPSAPHPPLVKLQNFTKLQPLHLQYIHKRKNCLFLGALVTWTYRKSPVPWSSSYGSTFISIIPENYYPKRTNKFSTNSVRILIKWLKSRFLIRLSFLDNWWLNMASK
jgi:hypothetical protein